jgi:hypothetical protein
VEFIKNEDYKYVRALGAFYMRLVGTSLDVYQYLEVSSEASARVRGAVYDIICDERCQERGPWCAAGFDVDGASSSPSPFG